ncbi:MAG: glycosyltransferase family 9 protein [Aquabacterium sp.]|uniref:glycosyltransferase family 9 protein n=1 Tax=Aquabacterium sp. TaxID=1872578 RepID=UPI003BDA1E0A
MSKLTDPRPRTVVLLQYTGIGDLIWHIHYFKMIAEQSQGGRVTVVAQPSTLTKAFIGKEPWVEAVIDHDHRPRRGEKRKGKHAGLAGMWRMANELKAGQFDRIILFSGRASRGLIAWLSGIPVRMGFGYKGLQRMFLNTPPYISAYKGEALAVYPEASAFMVAHGFCQEAIVPRMDVPDEMVAQMTQRMASLPRPLYAFAIGTSELHKQWGIPNFAELAHRLIQKGAGVVLLGGPAEVQIAKDIAAQVPEADRHALSIITDAPVLGSAAALRLADVCVGNDTGMINVAAAVGTNSYVLIGPRGTLNQDPELMHNVRAAKLADITVDRVMGLIYPPSTTHTKPGN